MRLAHILVARQYEAEDLQKLLQSGAEFESLAQKFSTCPSAKQGGVLGDIEPLRLDRQFDPDFAEAAKVLKAGEVSAPIRTRFGYHLIRRIS